MVHQEHYSVDQNTHRSSSKLKAFHLLQGHLGIFTPLISINR